MKKILKIIFAIFLSIFLWFLIFFVWFVFFVFSGWQISVYNQTNEDLSFKITFSQNQKDIASMWYLIPKNDEIKIKVPNKFNNWKIFMEIKNRENYDFLEIYEDFLYSFNVKFKIFIKNENWKIFLIRQ